MARSQQLTARIVAALVDEHERQKERISRLLHDELGQVLSAVGLQLDGIRSDIEHDSFEIARRLETCLGHLGRAIDQVRALSQEMNPAVVERAGLAAALRRLVAGCRDRHPNIHLSVDPAQHIPLQATVAFFRIAERAVDNAIRHGSAERIEILVKPHRGGLALEVRDDGRGFDPAKTFPGLGLPLMEHFAAHSGMRFRVTSGTGKGTIVKAHCPAAQLRHGFESTSS